MVGAFIDAGFSHYDAAIKALKANREAGQYAQATPVTKISQIIAAIPKILNHN
jgi:NAD(P)H-hydrate repair Nnr-like enzyme with NAD(P)H-hydrate dehydratase domain